MWLKFSRKKPLANKIDLFYQITLYNSKLNKISLRKTKRILKNRPKWLKLDEKQQVFYAFANQESFFCLNGNYWPLFFSERKFAAGWGYWDAQNINWFLGPQLTYLNLNPYFLQIEVKSGWSDRFYSLNYLFGQDIVLKFTILVNSTTN